MVVMGDPIFKEPVKVNNSNVIGLGFCSTVKVILLK